MATIIGFTASPPTIQEEFELLLLNRFFSNNILESELALKLQEGEKEPHIAEPILIEETSVITKLKARETPALVFCTSEHREELESALKESSSPVYVNNSERNVIEHLDDLEKLKLTEYPILLVDDV